MEAHVFQGPGRTAWQDVPAPAVGAAADAVVREDVVVATICGSDLRIVVGDVPDAPPGGIPDHEAVLVPEAFEVRIRTVRPQGRVADIGAPGRLATPHLEDRRLKDIALATGPVDTFSTPVPLRMTAVGRLPASALITHRFEPERTEEAYDVFARTGETGALEAVPGGAPHDEIAAPVRP
ncbi:hypothetical protein ABT282_06010 [Streptomyces sp. NPDC000927]|uniref:hypothetical protein n=1 Tax=unclassified Streptomyces TaxID=2593676 RepID=UPI00331E5866